MIDKSVIDFCVYFGCSVGLYNVGKQLIQMHINDNKPSDFDSKEKMTWKDFARVKNLQCTITESKESIPKFYREPRTAWEVTLTANKQKITYMYYNKGNNKPTPIQVLKQLQTEGLAYVWCNRKPSLLDTLFSYNKWLTRQKYNRAYETFYKLEKLFGSSDNTIFLNYITDLKYNI